MSCLTFKRSSVLQDSFDVKQGDDLGWGMLVRGSALEGGDPGPTHTHMIAIKLRKRFSARNAKDTVILVRTSKFVLHTQMIKILCTL